MSETDLKKDTLSSALITRLGNIVVVVHLIQEKTMPDWTIPSDMEKVCCR